MKDRRRVLIGLTRQRRADQPAVPTGNSKLSTNAILSIHVASLRNIIYFLVSPRRTLLLGKLFRMYAASL